MRSNFSHIHSNMSGIFTFNPLGSSSININLCNFTDILSLGNGALLAINPNSIILKVYLYNCSFTEVASLNGYGSIIFFSQPDKIINLPNTLIMIENCTAFNLFSRYGGSLIYSDYIGINL